MDDDIEDLVVSLLVKVRRILPAHAEFIAEAASNGAPRGRIAHALEELGAVRDVLEEFEEYLYD